MEAFWGFAAGFVVASAWWLVCLPRGRWCDCCGASFRPGVLCPACAAREADDAALAAREASAVPIDRA